MSNLRATTDGEQRSAESRAACLADIAAIDRQLHVVVDEDAGEMLRRDRATGLLEKRARIARALENHCALAPEVDVLGLDALLAQGAPGPVTDGHLDALRERWAWGRSH
ncbi:hypothetical protein [Corynebacterium sp. AOP12-C2-36]|uniref:hypothetical protein n=1 Tax=Corynebacterium sp. AOP12-C2-36 TaxID=3457723 RepID=UPI0040342345